MESRIAWPQCGLDLLFPRESRRARHTHTHRSLPLGQVPGARRRTKGAPLPLTPFVMHVVYVRTLGWDRFPYNEERGRPTDSVTQARGSILQSSKGTSSIWTGESAYLIGIGDALFGGAFSSKCNAAIA